MSIPAIASVVAAAIAALLSIVMFFQGGSSLALQTDLQTHTQDFQTQQQEIQQEVQTQQQKVQIQQDELQARQQRLNTVTQLAQQQGPQVIASLKVAGMRSNNAKIFALLTKYGVQVTDKDKEDIKKLLNDPAKTQPK